MLVRERDINGIFNEINIDNKELRNFLKKDIVYDNVSMISKFVFNRQKNYVAFVFHYLNDNYQFVKSNVEKYLKSSKNIYLNKYCKKYLEIKNTYDLKIFIGNGNEALLRDFLEISLISFDSILTSLNEALNLIEKEEIDDDTKKLMILNEMKEILNNK